MKIIDKIRSMSEDELAEVIFECDSPSSEVFGGRFEKFCESRCRTTEDGDIECVSRGNCKGCIKEWLNSEYEE